MPSAAVLPDMQPTPTVLIAGGTGLIGKRLSQMLAEQGWELRILTRRPEAPNQYFWNPAALEMDEKALQGADHVINLAGAGIADRRWTAARKKEIVESRVQSTLTLSRAISKLEQQPNCYVTASAIGIYGNSGEAWMREDSPPADRSFMVECCQQWESAADTIAALGVRTVKFRIGVVLAKEGGALPEITKTFPFGLGVYFGNGQAWWPWVHIDDVCRAFLWALGREDVSGTYNLVAPNPLRGIELVKAAAKAMGKRPLFLPAPAWALRAILGEMSAVILNSNRVSSEKLCSAGFVFDYAHVKNI
jgi:TIGR01777 family protein